MELSKNVGARDVILFGEPYKKEKYMGGVRYFSGLDKDGLKQLLDFKFADPECCQNDAPSIQEFYEFLCKHPLITCHGYAVDPRRSDYRVSIEGVEYEGVVTMEMFVDFMDSFRLADELNASEGYLYCWYN